MLKQLRPLPSKTLVKGTEKDIFLNVLSPYYFIKLFGRHFSEKQSLKTGLVIHVCDITEFWLLTRNGPAFVTKT